MTVRIFLLFVCLLTWGSSQAAAEPAPPETWRNADLEAKMCAFSPCQRKVRVTVKRADGSLYDNVIDVLPGSVQPDGLVVLAGQSLYFEAELIDGQLANVRSVDRVALPGKTITAKFEQLENGGMMLSVFNPFDQALKFDMMISPISSEKIFQTSSCPVLAKASAFEMWPEPLFQVLLFRARVVAVGKTMECT